MKNVFSKSTPEFDFQKFFNLVLTEQRCQRVDLARLHKLIIDLNKPDIIDDIPPEVQQEIDDSSRGE